MDYTIQSVSDLERALARTKVESDNLSGNNTTYNNAVSPAYGTTTIPESVQFQHREDSSTRPLTSKERMNTSQMSTSALLTNIAAHQAVANTKLNILTDAVNSLYNMMGKIHEEQAKQTQILSSISRNTINITTATPSAPAVSKGIKAKNGSIKDYGFSTASQLFAEFLIKLIQQVDIQAMAKSRQYKSTRDFSSGIVTQVVNIAIGNEFKINGVLQPKLDVNSQTHPALVKAASQIGSVDDTNRIFTPDSIREMLYQIELKYFVQAFEEIVNRIRVIRLLIPFYEADLISAIRFPYFNEVGQAICDWQMIVSRDETLSETRVANASVTKRKDLAKLIAKGMTERAAIGAILNSA